MPDRAANDRRRVEMLLWVIVLIELACPIPAALSLGAIWVLLARPAWFPELVRKLYA